MKPIFLFALGLLAWTRASAQVSVELKPDQDQFLPNEAIRLTVKITNRSGQPLHLGGKPNWLTFNAESEDGPVVVQKGDVPTVDAFDLESSQAGIIHVDIEPYFELARPGRYKVIATMKIPQWSATLASTPIHFDIINGSELWSQDFGVSTASSATPDPRKYTLLKANYLREQLRLYVQVTSEFDGHIFQVTPLGPLVSFSSPEEQLDRSSQLHVLWQTGAQSFSYVIVSPGGTVVSRDVYDDFNSRPRLAVNADGDVVVTGGVRRRKPDELAPPAKLGEATPPNAPAPTK
jgi:hypothetical protein